MGIFAPDPACASGISPIPSAIPPKPAVLRRRNSRRVNSEAETRFILGSFSLVNVEWTGDMVDKPKPEAGRESRRANQGSGYNGRAYRLQIACKVSTGWGNGGYQTG